MTRAGVIVLLCGLVALRSPLLADGERTNVRGMGMARTFVVSSRGLDAVGINPANLGFPTDGAVTFSLLPFGLGIHVGTDFLDYGLYKDYFTGVQTDSGNVARYLNSQDKQRILDAFHNSGGLLDADVEMLLFGISVQMGRLGAVALTVTEHAQGYMNIPRDYASFLFNGNPPGSTYDFSSTDVKGSWTRTYALSYGTMLRQPKFMKSLAVGGAVKLIHGFGYADVQRFNTVLTTGSDGVLSGSVHFQSRASGVDFLENNNNGSDNNGSDNNGSGNIGPGNNGPGNNGPGSNGPNNNGSNNNGPGYSPFPSPAGVGYAVDLGVAGEINDFLSVGLSITDIGTMRWTGNVLETSVDTTMVVDDPLVLSNRDAIENTLKGRKTQGEPFSSALPTQLRLGVAVQVDQLPVIHSFPGTMLAELDYNQGFQNTPGSTTTPRISLGVEYLPLSWLPIRTGLSLGGIDRSNLAFGFGLYLGVFEFGLASDNVTWLFSPDSFSKGSIAIGMRWHV